MLTRRSILRSTALIPVALAVNGCAQLASAVAIAPQAAADVALIAKAVGMVLPTIEALTGLAGGAKNTAISLINTIENAASQIATAAAPTAKALVVQISDALAQVGSIVSDAKNLPAIVSAAISNGLALLPGIEALVGIVTQPLHARRFAAAVSPDQARANLQALVAGR